MTPESLSRSEPHDWLLPEWDGGPARALMSTRHGGVSHAPWDSMNLGAAVGDAPDAVARNRAIFASRIGATPVYLRQVHGTRVVRLSADDAQASICGAAAVEADASVTTEPGVACVVQVADCLPVLLAAPHGRGVAAAHAGWRGLAGGILEEAVGQLCDAAACRPAELRAWLGPCIGPRRFEVGPDVLEACGVRPGEEDPLRFKPHAAGKWLANLPQLARDRLAALGIRDVSGGGWCTVEDASRFFSFRRERVTGRMAAAIWLER